MSSHGTPSNPGSEPLYQWLAAYDASVDDAAELCGPILDELLTGSLKQPAPRAELLDLLRLLEELLADPGTMACAMLFIGVQHGETAQEWRSKLPGETHRQLQELLRLKQFESENLGAGTERSAEGLRRLLLALVRDVRVVLI
ncbi:MAG: HD domain-containing protein, partial [Xanthomonadales bacterium]|nr:HD domain-containing protein [Xanthomonadales bacterium]